MNRKEAVELFVSVWKLEYGNEWVEWDTAMDFKSRVWGDQPKLLEEYGVLNMIDDKIMEQLDPSNEYVRLKQNEPVSIK